MFFDRIPWTMMMKLYKADVLKNSKALSIPKEFRTGEDLIANVIFANKIIEVSYINNDGYVYCNNDNSTTQNRNWSLEYAVKFLTYVKQNMGDNNFCFTGYWLLCLRAIKNLLLNGVTVSRTHSLYRFVIDNRCVESLGIGDKLVLTCPYPQLTHFLLKLINKIKV